MKTSLINEVIIDGDMIKFECGFAAEASFRHICEEHGEEFDREFTPLELTTNIVDERIANICAMFDCPPDECMIFFSGSHNFRYEDTTLFDYKANRKDARRPIHEKNIEAYIKSKYITCQMDGYEADDALAMHLTKNPVHCVLCSRDKDMWMVPGWHYSWELGRQAQRGPELVGEHGYLKLEGKKLIGAGNMWFAAQLLMGDATDNIPGIPKCGPARAYKRLKDCRNKDDLIYVICNEYAARYGAGYEEMLNQVGNCLWLRRKEDAGKWRIDNW